MKDTTKDQPRKTFSTMSEAVKFALKVAKEKRELKKDYVSK